MISSIKKFVVPILLLVVVAALVLFVFRSRETSFPALEVGAYQGTISGLTSGVEHTLFIERFSDSGKMLVLVFKAGWRPQVKTYLEEPLRILSPEQIEFNLSGRLTDNSGDFSRGYVFSDGQKVGSWKLGPAFGASVKDAGDSVEDEELKEWISLRVNYHTLKKELEGLDQQLAEQQEKKDKLQSFLGDERALWQPARRRTRLRRLETARGVVLLMSSLVQRRRPWTPPFFANSVLPIARQHRSRITRGDSSGSC